MGAYILRRLLLVIPTLLGIMIINFVLTQYIPGGPIEQTLARLEGGGDVLEGIAGGGDPTMDDGGAGSSYIGARGLPPDFIAELEVNFGFARIVCAEGFTGTPSVKDPACEKELIPATERFFIMMGNYLTFDFGESYQRSISVVDLILEKMPVSITLGLWSTLIAYLISIPLG
ncbi:MAG: microcin ABC transporter permease, partial [Paracoccaceae bacterium]